MKKNQGFTLIELIVVIAIIAILAGLVYVKVGDPAKKARDVKRVETINQVRDALEMFYFKYGRYPAIDQGLGNDTYEEAWHYLGQCLTLGKGCWSAISPASARPYGGADIPGFVSDLSKWENDPQNKTPNTFEYDDTTYWSNFSCPANTFNGLNHGYVLVAYLEGPRVNPGHGGNALLNCYNDSYCDDDWVYCLKEKWD